MGRFDPQKYIIKIKGKDYLRPVHRVMWMRSEHPRWGIETVVESSGAMIYVRAILRGDNGELIATGLSTIREAGEKEQTWQGRIVEKAETAAIGRCLSHAGYGTEYSGDELDDSDYLADSPFDANTGMARKTQPKSTTAQKAGPNGAQNTAPKTPIPVVLTKLRVILDGNNRRLGFTTKDGKRITAFSRREFIESGWCDENEWQQQEEFDLFPEIPCMAVENDKGYLEIVPGSIKKLDIPF